MQQVLNYAQSDFVGLAGMKISTTPLKVAGRIMTPPMIGFGNEVDIEQTVRSCPILNTVFF